MESSSIIIEWQNFMRKKPQIAYGNLKLGVRFLTAPKKERFLNVTLADMNTLALLT